MKLTIDKDGTVLVLRAETPSDLDFLEKMQGIHEPGPWADAGFQVVDCADLGFDHCDAGKCYLTGGKVTRVMAVVHLKLDWLSYAEPKTPEQILRANTAARIGHSLLDGFKLACA
jgi:hypothetical protein